MANLPLSYYAAGIRCMLTALFVLFAAGGASAQSSDPASSTTSAMTPTGMSPGSPAGSYPLSGFDDVNLFNGNLNIRLPLLTVGGRGSAGYTMTLSAGTKKWQVRTEPGQDTDGGGGPIGDRYTPRWAQWNTLQVGYGPGVMQGRKTGVKTVLRRTCDTCPIICNRTTPMYRYTLTRLTFISPDGTEHELRDAETGGEPMPVEQARCNDVSNVGAWRGRRFVSANGAAMTFVSDADIFDDVRVSGTGSWVFGPSGVLYTRDGTSYRIHEGRVSWIRDRNGNLVTFTYGAATVITDSLGRKVTVEYDLTGEPYGKHDRITYHGFGGTSRVVRVSKTLLGQALRAPHTVRTYPQLFPDLNGAAGVFSSVNPPSQDFNPEVVSAVWLPDGVRKYRLFYNSYAEVARVELPTGGATEYDMVVGSGVFVSSGAVPGGGEERQVYRRLKESRVYTGPTADTLVSRTVYTAGDGVNEFNGTTVRVDRVVKVERFDAANRLLALSKHYFSGSAAESLFTRAEGSLYSPAGEGRETSTDSHDTTDTSKVLRGAVNTWEQREPVAWVGHLESWGSNLPPPGLSIEPDNDPRLVKVVTKLETGQVTKRESDYDIYNNEKEVREYGYGQTEPTTPLRRTVTEYLTTHPVGGVDYAGATSGVHIRNLPLNQYVYAGTSTTPTAKIGYEYDNYTVDAAGGVRHAALLPRASITGLCAFYDGTGNCFSPDDPSRPPASYTTRGNLTGTTRYLLAADGSVTSSVVTNQHYDVAGNVVKIIDPRSTPQTPLATTVEYDDHFGAPDGEARANSTPAELVNAQGTQVSYAFPTRLTTPAGHVIRCQYDYHTGRAVDGEDVNGVVASGFYEDVFDRPTKLIAAANVTARRRETTFSYDDANRTVTTESDLNTFQDTSPLKGEAVYDGLGRTVEARQYESATEYIVTLTRYDGLGRVSETSNPHRPLAQPAQAPVWTTSEYDSLGRVWRVTTPDGAQVVTTYGGAQTLVADQAGNRRLSETDALGRLAKVWEIKAQDADTTAVTLPGGGQAYGYLTSYEYDVLGNLRTVTQGAQTRTFAYDSLSRLRSATNPEACRQEQSTCVPVPVTYDYYADGSLHHRTDARGVVTTYAYDAIGRVTSRTYSDSTPPVSYFYDAQTLPDGAPVFDRGLSTGRLVAVTYGGAASTTGSYLGGYDAMGRPHLSRQRTDTGTVEGLKTYEMAYSYDLAGNLKTQTYPSGRVVETSYDAAGRVAGVMNQATGSFYAGASGGHGDRIRYTAHGAVEAMRLGNGLWEHVTYNSRLQPEQSGLGSAAGIDPLKLRLTYGYGPGGGNNGNLKSQRIEGGGLDVTQTYEYDALNRLAWAEEKVGTGSKWKQIYEYDRYGNRRFASGTTYPNYTQSLTDPVGNPVIDPANNRIKTSEPGQGNYLYDAAGNLTRMPVTPQTYHDLAYDAEHKQVRADGGGAAGGADYYYDGDGKRVKKVSAAEHTVFVYDVMGRVVAEYSNQAQNGGTRYLTQDHLGSTRVVTDAQGNAHSNGGAKGARHDYLPFGEELYAGTGERMTGQGYSVADNIRQKFTGYERDAETGLDFAQARYYASKQGRFTSPDEFFNDTTPASPQKWNLYVYVNNNPLNAVDPTGMRTDFIDQQGNRTRINDGRDQVIYVHSRTLQLLQNYYSADGLLYFWHLGQLEQSRFNLHMTAADLDTLAGVIYAEASNQATSGETAAIHGVLRNRAMANGTTVLDEATDTSQIFGARETERKKIFDKFASESKKQAVYQGIAISIVTGEDLSKGAYFWHGTDFAKPTRGSHAHEQFYLVGFQFTSKAHDIWGLGDRKSGQANWDYKYVSTSAHGKTTFMKLTEAWKKAHNVTSWNGK